MTQAKEQVKSAVDQQQVDREEWLILFRTLDDDNDGFIGVEQLRNRLAMSSASLGMSADDLKHLLTTMDSNHNHVIDFHEFCYLIQMTQSRRALYRKMVLLSVKSVLHEKSGAEINYLMEYNCFPAPFFLIFISALQLAIFLFYGLTEPEGIMLSSPAPINSILILQPDEECHVWRYITYQFVHFGYGHISANLLLQLILGIPLELVHKFWRIGSLYTLGVITGALFSRALTSNVILGGASAGVYCMLSAHVSNVVINWAEMKLSWLRLGVVSALVGVDVGLTIYEATAHPNEYTTSYLAHIGGCLTGLLMGVVLLRNLRLKNWERVLWWIALGLYLIMNVVLADIVYFK